MKQWITIRQTSFCRGNIKIWLQQQVLARLVILMPVNGSFDEGVGHTYGGEEEELHGGLPLRRHLAVQAVCVTEWLLDSLPVQ